MPNIIIDSDKHRLFIKLNDLSDECGIEEGCFDKKDISIEMNNNKSDVFFNVKDKHSWRLSHNGSKDSHKVDTISGINPSSNIFLFDELKKILSTNNFSSNSVLITTFSNSNLSNLATTISEYLNSSNKEFVSLNFSVNGTVTTTHYAYLTERNGN